MTKNNKKPYAICGEPSIIKSLSPEEYDLVKEILDKTHITHIEEINPVYEVDVSQVDDKNGYTVAVVTRWKHFSPVYIQCFSHPKRLFFKTKAEVDEFLKDKKYREIKYLNKKIYL